MFSSAGMALVECLRSARLDGFRRAAAAASGRIATGDAPSPGARAETGTLGTVLICIRRAF